MSRRRWGDNDKHFGPITYARDYGWAFGAVLDSGSGDYPGCNLRLKLFGIVLILEIPGLLSPHRRWVDCSHYGWQTAGVSGYWDEHPREYGFNLNSDGFLQLFFGPQTNDSSTTKDWCHFLPFTQWRHVRFSLYDLDGRHFWTTAGEGYDVQAEAENKCPSASFSFLDYDAEPIQARTMITEREWRFGTGWFKWLSLFRKPRISRCLDIRFSKETGRKKGSWKGGTVGHAIEMLPDELHESSFRRYCAQHEMLFIERTK